MVFVGVSVRPNSFLISRGPEEHISFQEPGLSPLRFAQALTSSLLLARIQRVRGCLGKIILTLCRIHEEMGRRRQSVTCIEAEIGPDRVPQTYTCIHAAKVR